jgi:hypothetical protein
MANETKVLDDEAAVDDSDVIPADLYEERAAKARQDMLARKTGAKLKKLGPEVEAEFEKLIARGGGVTAREAGSHLANVFGKADLIDASALKTAEQKEKREALRRSEVEAGAKLFMEWIGKQGPERRDGLDMLVGVGDRISFKEGHYRQTW